jgi:tagatose 1,6-diphosphate aldolase
MKNDFEFINPGKLINNNLELILIEKTPANEEKECFPAYKFEMRHKKTKEKMGHIDLRISNNEIIKYIGHIGYGVDKKFRGNRYASRSIKLLLSLAKKYNLNPLWITCYPENIPSKKSCELAGGKLIKVDGPPKNNKKYKNDRKKCQYKFNL